MIGLGTYAVNRVLGCVPDLSDVQVIIYTEYPGQAPQVVEDQITYPLSTAMLAVPKSRVVRGLSVFGASFIYVIFEDNTDIYWARTRVLEYLNFASGRMPRGVTPTLGPDATALAGYTNMWSWLPNALEELRTIQDWFVRYQLTGPRRGRVAAWAASRQTYQVTVEPRKLQAYGISLRSLRWFVPVIAMWATGDRDGQAIRRAWPGLPARISDIENWWSRRNMARQYDRDIARVELAPDERRGIAELNGEGEPFPGSL